MKNIWTKDRLFLTILFLAIFSLSLTYFIMNGMPWYYKYSRPFILSASVATVGGEKVSMPEFSFYLAAVKKEMEERAKIPEDKKAKEEFWKSKIAGEEAINVAINEVMERIHEEKIELILAKQSRMELTHAEIVQLNSAIDARVKKSANPKNADDDFIKEFGVNVKQYREIFREFRLIFNYLSEEQKKINVNDKEAKEYYLENRDKLDTVTVRHIMFYTWDNFRNTPLSEKEQNQARGLAYNTLERIRAGENAETLATSLSQDPSVSGNKGLLEVEFIGPKSNVEKEVKDWALSSYKGDSDVIKTIYGYDVLKVEERTEFEEVKKKAVEALQSYKLQEKINELKKDVKYRLVRNEKVISLFNR